MMVRMGRTEDVNRNLAASEKESHGDQAHDPVEGHLLWPSARMRDIGKSSGGCTGGSWSWSSSSP
jgi:hypothetical protein